MNRAQRRSCRKHGDPVYGTVAAWAAEDEASQREGRRRSHDALLKIMGDRRAGPVSWHTWAGDEARAVLVRMRRGSTAELAAYYDALAAKLDAEGGVLIVAKAPSR